MVQEEISQLSQECSNWRESLRSYRDEITKCQMNLQEFAGKNLSKEDLQEVEHYHNQFHIQLINIHDLKQSIKLQDRKVNLELAANNSLLLDEAMNRQELLMDEYAYLTETIKDLQTGFKQLVKG